MTGLCQTKQLIKIYFLSDIFHAKQISIKLIIKTLKKKHQIFETTLIEFMVDL